jgi:hypothetical protein
LEKNHDLLIGESGDQSGDQRGGPIGGSADRWIRGVPSGGEGWIGDGGGWSDGAWGWQPCGAGWSGGAWG